MVSTLTLEPSKVYRFHHKRKGEFTARYLGSVPTKPGDQEANFLSVEIDTRTGGPSAWMADARDYSTDPPTTPPITFKYLRPSLILGVAEVEENCG